jgi:hypothetical protein
LRLLENHQIRPFLISPKTKERPDRVGALFIPAKLQFLVPVVVMIVIIPVVLVVPATLMLIPPFMAVLPAPFSSFMELVPPVIRLSAVVTVLFNRAVQLVVRVNQLSLAIVACVRSRRSCQQYTAREHHCPASKSDQACFPSTCNYGFHFASWRSG